MFAYRISGNVADPDLYHQLALAREALRAGAVPRTDVFAFTPVHPLVVHHEWGAGFVALGVATALGGWGILALRYALAAAIAAVVLRTARRAGADLAALALAAPVAILLAEYGFSPVRAQLYTFLGVAFTLACFERDRAGARGWTVAHALALALAAPVAILLAEYGFSPVRAQLYTFLGVAFTLACFERDRAGARGWTVAHALALVVWTNLHGGFAVGLLLVAAYAVEAALARRRAGHVVALLAVEVLLTLANPWGAAFPASIARALLMPRPRIPEWASLLGAGVPPGHLVAFGVALLLVGYGLWRGRERPRGGLVLVALTGAMAMRAHRLLPIFAIAWLAYAPALLASTPLADDVRDAARRAPRALGAGAAAVALAFLVLLARARPWPLAVPNAPTSPGEAQSYPVGATRFLRLAGFRGRLMTTFETGAYVSWKLYPDVRVSLDGRYEAAYPDAVFADVMAFYEGRIAPDEILARYAPDAVLVPRHRPAPRASLPWPAVYDDGAFAVLVRPDVRLAHVPGPISTEDRFP